jgi:hypothetical protein
MLLENEAVNLSYLWEHKVLWHIQVNCTHDGALVEEEVSSNSVRHDAATHVDLGAVANILHYSMWVLTAPNPAIVVVYKTMCVESSFVGKNNFLEIIVICSELF